MKRWPLALLLAGASLAAGAARAQSNGYGDPPPATRPMPGYREEAMPAPGPAGGYDETITSGDARRDDRAQPEATPPREDDVHRRDRARTADLNRRRAAPASADYRDQFAAHERDMRDYQAERARYAERIARWRARADACEAGHVDACEGPAD